MKINIISFIYLFIVNFSPLFYFIVHDYCYFKLNFTIWLATVSYIKHSLLKIETSKYPLSLYFIFIHGLLVFLYF